MNPLHLPEREDEKPAILYFRFGGLLVRDPARAEAETAPAARELSAILSLSGLAALVGSVLGLLVR